MLQQDVYSQQRQSVDGRIKIDLINLNYSFLEQVNSNEQMMTTSDTMKDANETLSKSLIFSSLISYQKNNINFRYSRKISTKYTFLRIRIS